MSIQSEAENVHERFVFCCERSAPGREVSKEHITALLYTNAQLPILIIGKN